MGARQRWQHYGVATDLVQLTGSKINASVQGSATNVGGNITIATQFVNLQNSQILGHAVHGQGGNMSIITNLLLPDATCVTSVSSKFDINGTVTTQSPNAPISGLIQPLNKAPLPQRCCSPNAARGSSAVSPQRGGFLTQAFAVDRFAGCLS